MRRDTEARGLAHDLAGIGVEAHRRNRRVDVQRQERPLQERLPGAGDEVAHLGDLLDVLGFRGCAENVFGSPGEAGIGGVDIEAEQIRHVEWLVWGHKGAKLGP